MAETKELPAPKTKEEDELKGSEAPLLDHLIELRKRLIYSVIAIAVFFVICFAFGRQIYDILVIPFTSAGGTGAPACVPQSCFFAHLQYAAASHQST